MLAFATAPAASLLTAIALPAAPPTAPPTAAAPAVVIPVTALPILLLAPPGIIHEASSGTNFKRTPPVNSPTTYIQVLPIPCIPRPPISPHE